jgi:cellulose synthase/poly-beta-1,6-N-acetylglucosamine synthase-like glycosyltransferase
MVEWLFWGCALLLWYAYVGYPLLLLLFGSLNRQPVSRPSDQFEPSVSLVIAVHNEEAVIRDKIENCLSLDYPDDRLEILIVSDASFDGTHAIVEEYVEQGVRLMIREQREGKTSALNAACPLAKGDILVLSDANGIFGSDAIRKLVRHFSDPRVGCVCGTLRYENPSHGVAHQGESLFLRYSAWIKQLESRFGAVLGVFGGIFAFRRDFFEPMHPMRHNDMDIPLRILRRGYKVLYEADAVCCEPSSPRVGIEFGRHARISARAFQGIMSWIGCFLRPIRPFLLFEFFSAKLLRWLSPFALLALLGVPFFLDSPFYHVLQLLNLALLFTASIGAVLYWAGKSHPVASLLFYLLVGNLAVAWGFVKFVTGTQGATWSVVREGIISPAGNRLPDRS